MNRYRVQIRTTTVIDARDEDELQEHIYSNYTVFCNDELEITDIEMETPDETD